ncbi:hypothetical protein BJV82DRAFT_603462 [Fennellomyces sp. T-0311]|nr:hypothetical protein BJV82DRAFT_603462 [Fennellomyces sp. T-0311]
MEKMYTKPPVADINRGPWSRLSIIAMVSLSTLLLGGYLCMSHFMRCSAALVPELTPLGVPWQGEPVSIPKNVYKTKNIAFLPHEDWLGQELDYQYVLPVAQALNTTEEPLLTRGESHITVITPPEFYTLAEANVTIGEINEIALEFRIQSSKFNLVCVGKESLVVDEQKYVVYQLIADAPNLQRIREAVFRLYVSKGGNPALFDPHVSFVCVRVDATVDCL